MAHKSLSQLDAFDFSPREVKPVISRNVTEDFKGERNGTNSAASPSPSTADLALDLVLNEMLQQARLASGATGAAAALLHGSQIVCRAAAGATATEVAGYLAMDCKVVDTCLRSGNAQRSDDTESDSRFDVVACKRLGLRSVIVVPVKNKDEKTVGVVEIFSSRASAFADRDVLMLEGIGRRVLHNMEVARQVMSSNAVAAAAPPVVPINHRHRITDLPKRIHIPSSLRFWTRPLWGLPKPAFDSKLFLLLSAITLSLTLGWMLGRVHGVGTRRKVAPRVSTSTQPSEAPTVSSEPTGNAVGPVAPPTTSPSQNVQNLTEAAKSTTPDDESLPGVTIARRALPKHKESRPSIPIQTSTPVDDSAGSLVVFEDITKETPAQTLSTVPDIHAAVAKAPTRHTSTIRVSPSEAQENLIQRVEPTYPEEARAQNIQGRVVLDIIVDKKGAVHGISTISGDSQLALASARAVQQWRFKPLVRDGSPVQFETRVTLNFSLQ